MENKNETIKKQIDRYFLMLQHENREVDEKVLSELIQQWAFDYKIEEDKIIQDSKIDINDIGEIFGEVFKDAKEKLELGKSLKNINSVINVNPIKLAKDDTSVKKVINSLNLRSFR